jgi:putative FmdB family regulatory protein
MPIYEYVCPDCNLKFELLRPLSEASQVAACPRCQNKAKRVFSTFSSFTTDESGLTTRIAGSNPCSSCSTFSCDSCNL